MKRFFCVLTVLALASCAPPPVRKRVAAVPQPTPRPTAAPGIPAPTPVPVPKTMAVFYAVHPASDPAVLLSVLASTPTLRMTLAFPPGYFNDEKRRPALARFRALQASKQIEIALTLEDQPVLPLLGDLRLGGAEVSKWHFGFAWPEDIAAQVARGSGRYQKRWTQLPSGLVPPYLALSETTVDTLRRFRLNWVIGRPNAAWGVRYYGGTALLVSPVPPASDQPVGSRKWADDLVAWSLSNPFVFIDGTTWEDPAAQDMFLRQLALSTSESRTGPPLVTGQEFAASLRNDYPLPAGAPVFREDFSDWVQSPLQKRAWQALSEARAAVGSYQRSGHANLQRLDAAVEEMCVAESGPFLLSLADPSGVSDLSERNFLATIANVYRLTAAPVPPQLNNWFADRSYRHAPTKSAVASDEPFYVEGEDQLTWNDPKGDDVGAGKWTYPVGNYPKGFFDLRSFAVSWTEDRVRFSFTVDNRSAGQTPPVVPGLDVYVDVNRLPGAGSLFSLPGRGSAAIDAQAAWEYAISLGATQAVLYQSIPGGNPRVLASAPLSVEGDQASASFSRQVLRGEPHDWRLTVGLFGAENNRRNEAPQPIEAGPTATEKSFGGAATGRTPPVYIDVLAETEQDQTQALSPYESGRRPVLPYVEAP